MCHVSFCGHDTPVTLCRFVSPPFRGDTNDTPAHTDKPDDTGATEK